MLTYLLVFVSNGILDSLKFGEYVCEVFYVKLNLNVWKVMLAFFPRNKLDVGYVCLFICVKHVSTLVSVGSGANVLEF